MKESGNIIRLKGKGNSLIQMEIHMMENGRMIWQMDMESINILKEQNMKGNGSMINNMDMVKKYGQMDHLIKDFFKVVINMEKVIIYIINNKENIYG